MTDGETDQSQGDAGPADGSFAGAMDELQVILAELESDEADIDRLASNVRRAATLINECRRRITAVEMEIEQIVAELEGDDPVVD